MMEAYHEAALQAHQRHAKPEVRLPDVDELQFAPTWSSNGDGEAHLALPAGEAPATQPLPDPPEPGQNGQGRPALESSEESLTRCVRGDTARSPACVPALVGNVGGR